MGSRLIIFFSIVGRREPCEKPFSPGLVFFGLCLARLRSYLLVGGQVVVLGELLCGKWFLFVLCAVFGGSKKIDVSRSSEELLHFFLFTLFTWTVGWLAPQVISFADFLSFFSSSP
jgi:hypothetical protein